jgi:alpha-tubulin suppressor-like RCC1 family protein
VLRGVVGHGAWRRGAAAGTVLALVASVCVAAQLVAPAPAAAAATVPAPAGSWPFSEGSGTTTADSSGHGYTGTLGSGVTWAAPEVGTHSIATNGTATGAVTVTGAVVNTAASYTVSAWVYLNAIGAAAQTFVSINGLATGTGSSISGFYLQFTGSGPDTFAFTVRASDATGTAVKQALGPANVVVHTWYHLVAVYNSVAQTIALYINGALQQSTAYTTAWQAAGNTMIGQAYYGAATDYVNGEIDDVALYSSALTAAQVAALNQPVISTGYSHTCEITSGNAYCWGLNASGELGNNSTVSSSVPVPVYTGGVLAGLTLTQISAGDNFTCALASTGGGYCWGGDSDGELGNGTTTSTPQTAPVAVSGGLTLTQISAEVGFACAVTSAGAAYCWGLGTSGQLGTTAAASSSTPVAVNTSGVLSAVTVIQISVGITFACALGSAGAAYCWGLGTSGQLGNNLATSSNVPVAVTTTGTPMAGVTLTQITAGNGFACALGSAGAAYCWGTGSSYRLGDDSNGNSNVPVAVTMNGLTFTRVTAGDGYGCALLSAGAAYCWGQGTNGTLGNNSVAVNHVPGAVTTSGVLSGVTLTQVSASGYFSTCALDTSGTAYCWGVNSSGQVGNPDTANNFLVPATVALSQTTTVAAGNIHSCEIDSGKAYCWGDNSNGELGNNSTMTSSVPVAAWTSGVLSGVTLTEITTGTNFSCALSAAGAAYCWGLGTSGQLGNNSILSSSLPVAVYTGGALSGLTLTQITANGASACALASTGAAFCWGAGGSGQLGNGTTSAAQSTAVPVTTSGVLSGLILTGISSGGTSTCALASTGVAFCWGAGGSGQLGNGTTTAAQSTAVAVTVTAGVLAGVTLTWITTGSNFACALASTGVPYCWGLGTSGQLGNSASLTSTTAVAVTTSGVLSGVTLTQIGVGSNSSCALSAAGAAYCWGVGAVGQLGNGSTTAIQNTAVAVTATGVLSGLTLTQITVGTTFVCALSNTGADFCWGANASGQLGNPATTASAATFDVPVAVMSQATMIATGYNHSCMLRNGKAYCWGDDTYGELGNNTTTTTPQSTPVAVYTGGVLSGLTLIQISAGETWTCALASTGNAYCWGNNSTIGGGDVIALGNNTATASSQAVLVSGGLTFTQISVGSDFACALTSAGVAYCWGNNHDGQIGNSSTSFEEVPVPVTTSGVLSGKTLTQIAAGGLTACALSSAGAAYCWGFGTSGQLGNSASSTTSAAVTVTTSGVLSGVALVQITVGGTFTCALGSAGGAYCWGAGGSGQLGNGSTTATQNTAVAVSATSTGMPLTQITAGTSFACAVDVTGAAYCWGLGSNGQLGNGSTTAAQTTPTAVTATGVLAGATLFQIDAGQNFTCVQDTTGAFYCWGVNTTGDLGNASTTQSNVPVIVGGIVPGAPTSVAAFPASTTAAVYWATPASLGTGTLTGYLATASPGGATCSTTSALTCTISGLTNGTTYTVTVVTETTDGNSASSIAATVTPWPPEAIAAGGRESSCAIYSGKAYCWGDDSDGELGNGVTTSTAQLTPVAVYTGGVLVGVTLTQITMGYWHVCALASTGAAYCWGRGNDGELGNGTTSTTPSNVPVAVTMGGLTFTQISAGQYSTCAVSSAGTAYCWGQGSSGQLGVSGSTASSSTPVAVTTSGTALSGRTLVQVAAGYYHTCALDSTGLVYCWGTDTDGQVGTTTTVTSTPQPAAAAVYTTGTPMAGRIIVQITAGGQHTCALDSTGLAYCWGYGTNGQLGNNGTPSSQAVPLAVYTAGALVGVTLATISATEFHTCALGSTGVAFCWGYNADGRLGTNNTTTVSVPTAVYTGGALAGRTVTQVGAGDQDSCALDSTGTAFCWGNDANGQLGNDATAEANAAVLVGPQAPTSVTATPGDATAAMSWTTPVYLNNGTVTGYTFTTSPGAFTCATTGATSCTITGLTDGTTYTVTGVTTTTTVLATTGTSAPSIAATVEPVGFLTLTSPTSLTWAVTGNGSNRSVVDAVSGDQQLTATDNTATGAGWHITVSATTFTTGPKSLPNAGAVNFTGSVSSSLAGAAPTATCVGSCTLPTDTTTYPVVMATAVSSPTVYTVYDTSVSTGEGVMTIGGSAATDPIGWWVQVPASVYVGSYTSTVTLEVVSGP